MHLRRRVRPPDPTAPSRIVPRQMTQMPGIPFCIPPNRAGRSQPGSSLCRVPFSVATRRYTAETVALQLSCPPPPAGAPKLVVKVVLWPPILCHHKVVPVGVNRRPNHVADQDLLMQIHHRDSQPQPWLRHRLCCCRWLTNNHSSCAEFVSHFMCLRQRLATTRLQKPRLITPWVMRRVSSFFVPHTVAW